VVLNGVDYGPFCDLDEHVEDMHCGSFDYGCLPAYLPPRLTDREWELQGSADTAEPCLCKWTASSASAYYAVGYVFTVTADDDGYRLTLVVTIQDNFYGTGTVTITYGKLVTEKPSCLSLAEYELSLISDTSPIPRANETQVDFSNSTATIKKGSGSCGKPDLCAYGGWLHPWCQEAPLGLLIEAEYDGVTYNGLALFDPTGDMNNFYQLPADEDLGIFSGLNIYRWGLWTWDGSDEFLGVGWHIQFPTAWAPGEYYPIHAQVVGGCLMEKADMAVQQYYTSGQPPNIRVPFNGKDTFQIGNVITLTWWDGADKTRNVTVAEVGYRTLHLEDGDGDWPTGWATATFGAVEWQVTVYRSGWAPRAIVAISIEPFACPAYGESGVKLSGQSSLAAVTGPMSISSVQLTGKSSLAAVGGTTNLASGHVTGKSSLAAMGGPPPE